MSLVSPNNPDATPAATLVVFRRAAAGGPAELLMVERSAKMRFAAGMAVFPGGRVDPADLELAERIRPPALPDHEAVLRIAAIRETLEETGLLVGVEQPVSAEAAAAARDLLLAESRLDRVLDRFGWSLDLARLVPFARWCPDVERAFDTRFYLADLGTGAVTLSADGTENLGLYWSSAADMLAAVAQGRARAIFPTLRNLERLALYPDFAAAAAHAAERPVATITPQIVERDGEQFLTIPEGLGYPVTCQPLAEALRS